MSPSSRSSPSHVARSAVLVAVLFSVDKVLALARDIVIGRAFGASAQLDAYYAAFELPDGLFTVLAGSAMATTLIPILSARISRDEHEQACLQCILDFEASRESRADHLPDVACVFPHIEDQGNPTMAVFICRVGSQPIESALGKEVSVRFCGVCLARAGGANEDEPIHGVEEFHDGNARSSELVRNLVRAIHLVM